jgi:hypothetical protein
MTLQEIIDLTRRRLGDYELPLDWYDQELVDYTNYAIWQICRNSYLFEDAYTPAICNITTTSGTIDYLLSTSIVEIRNAKVTGYLSAIAGTHAGLDDISICGSYTHSDTDTSFKITIDGASTTDTFKWSDDGGTTWNATLVAMTADWQELSHGIFIKFAAKTSHTLTDFWTFTVYDQASSFLTLNTVPVLGQSIPSWRMVESEEPTTYLLDYRHGYISFYPTPDDSYLINLNVTRYPATNMSATSMSSQTPEIPAVFHMVLIDGIMYQAYNKTGTETYNSQKADRHFQLFKMGISDINRNMILNRANKIAIIPHTGTI